MKKVYVKPSVLAQDLCYDQAILMTGSPTFNPDGTPVTIDNALAGEDFGLGDDDNENSWGWGGEW